MTFLPGWAPNVHPIMVHFPIALLAVSPILDLAAIMVKRWSAAKTMADVTYILGAVSALVAYFTGRVAVEGLVLPAEAETTLTDHADWALRTVWFFGIYTVVRVSARVWKRRGSAVWIRLTDAGLLVLGVGGLFLLVQTGDRGAKMVFQFGVGVKAVEQANRSPSGSNPAAGASASSLFHSLQFLEGGTDNADESPRGVIFRVNDETVFALLPDTHQSFQAELQIYVTRLEGRFQFVHHVQSLDTFGSVSVVNGSLQLGRMENGVENVIAQAAGVITADWMTLRIVADRDHLRAYVDGRLLLHEHAAPIPAGPSGLSIQGKGVIQIRDLSVTKLRE
jgi:uncharacterized membrane protein